MVVLNKTDRLEEDKRGILNQIVSALNPTASIFECSYGKVPITEVFGRSVGIAAVSDDDEDIRTAVRNAKQRAKGHAQHGHEHASAHTHGDAHDHASGHSHGHEHASAHTNAHEHSQGHVHEHASHQHEGHSHGHEHAQGHSHGHEHVHAETAAEKYGISTFVYSRRRPFHPQRLLDLIAMRKFCEYVLCNT
jgi:G3E family GTPase